MSSIKSLEILETAKVLLKEAQANMVLTQRKYDDMTYKIEKMSHKDSKVEMNAQNAESEIIEKNAADEFGIGEVGESETTESTHPLKRLLDSLDI